MIIREVTDAQLVENYGTLFQLIYPNGGEDEADWGVGRAVVESGTQTSPHAHDEHEMFIITRGVATIIVDGKETVVTAGQAAIISAGVEHTLQNRASNERLEFFNVYWPPSMGPAEL